MKKKLLLVAGAIVLMGSCGDPATGDGYAVSNVSTPRPLSIIGNIGVGYEVTFDVRWQGEGSAPLRTCNVVLVAGNGQVLAETTTRIQTRTGNNLSATLDYTGRPEPTEAKVNC